MDNYFAANLFMEYHHEAPGTPDAYERIRRAGVALVDVMAENAPSGEMLDKAIQEVYEAVYKARRAIAEERKPHVRFTAAEANECGEEESLLPETQITDNVSAARLGA